MTACNENPIKSNPKPITDVRECYVPASYHVHARALDYADLGDAHLDRRNESTSRRALVKRLEATGYAVTIEKTAA